MNGIFVHTCSGRRANSLYTQDYFLQEVTSLSLWNFRPRRTFHWRRRCILLCSLVTAIIPVRCITPLQICHSHHAGWYIARRPTTISIGQSPRNNSFSFRSLLHDSVSVHEIALWVAGTGGRRGVIVPRGGLPICVGVWRWQFAIVTSTSTETEEEDG